MRKTLLWVSCLIVVVGFGSTSCKTQSEAPKTGSAIEVAAQREKEFNSLADKAKDLDISCSRSYMKECSTLIEKAATDRRLRDDLGRAGDEEIMVFAKDRFSSGNGWVDVNADADSEEIAEFIQNNAGKKLQELDFDLLRERAGQFGILCWSREAEICLALISKVEQNPDLRKACELAKSKNVAIFLDDHFAVHVGFVYVDANANPQEITEFLVGTKTN